MRTLVRWNPNREMVNMHRAMNRLFNEYSGGHYVNEGWRMPLDVIENEAGFEITANIPGVNADDIDITFEDKVLTIKAETSSDESDESENFHIRERRSGSFTRSLRLPNTVDVENISADYVNGVLTLSLPKAEAAKPKKISVGVGS